MGGWLGDYRVYTQGSDHVSLTMKRPKTSGEVRELISGDLSMEN